MLPVPAPATAALIKGLEVVQDGVGRERVPPTGAAILRCPAPVPWATGTLIATGLGFGEKGFDGLPNCLQAVFLADQSQFTTETDQVIVLNFEVDDQSPEDFAIATERLRKTLGTLSVVSHAAQGKKGRFTMSVELLCQPQYAHQVMQACFEETTTIGLRFRRSARLLLPRRQRRARVGDEEIEVKITDRPGGLTAKAEAREVEAKAGYVLRDTLRHQAERQALTDEGNDEQG